MSHLFRVIEAANHRIIKAWDREVPFEENTVKQLQECARLPFVKPYVAAMPDAHVGYGSTVGSVIPTLGAICPSLVGVDIGCGMIAAKLNLDTDRVKANLSTFRIEIEHAVPHGRTNHGRQGDRGAWFNVPEDVQTLWKNMFQGPAETLWGNYPGAKSQNTINPLSTLRTGNHFIELSEDQNHEMWLVIHSGSRGFGNRIGSYFSNLAKKLMERYFIELENKDLAYLPFGTEEAYSYEGALQLAQSYAWENRMFMVKHILERLNLDFPKEIVHVHHNYATWENHFGKNVLVTRKGAVRAREGELVIIPGSMGARTFIAVGLGNPDSFCSCSHGAGRAMGRKEAERNVSLETHQKALQGIECDKTAATLDETPSAYKDIDKVMASQADLVRPVNELRQLVCVKGGKE